MNGGLNILSSGMVTAVGLNRASACAAMRADIDGFNETQFMGLGGEWQMGAPVPLPRDWIGEKRLAHLAAGAIVDALEGHWHELGNLLLILCLAEPGRPGRPVRNPERFAAMVRQYSGLDDQTRTLIAAHGRPAGFVALDRARAIMAEGKADHTVIVGVDSMLTGPAIAYYLSENRLLGSENANGFIPGEAAAALLCAPGKPQHFALTGLGLTREEASIYNGKDKDGAHLPLRGDGMTAAYRKALDASHIAGQDLEYRMSDLIGEAYWFKQSALASQRTTRMRIEFQDLWSPGETLGNIGAAVVPLMIGWALEAYEKGYHPGTPVLVEASGDDGACGAAVFRAAAEAA